MNLAVVGSRSLKDNELAKEDAKKLIRGAIIALSTNKIISGGANGPDTWAEEVAKDMGIEVLVFKPDWKTYGKGAGYRRNYDIVKNADHILIFWDGASKGTQHDIILTHKQEKPYELFIFNGQEWRKTCKLPY